MTLLHTTRAPRHRHIFPGELTLSAGSRPSPGSDPSYPADVSVRLLSADCSSGTRVAARAGLCQLLARHGMPVMIIAGRPRRGGAELASRADLAAFTGQALAGELLAHAGGLLAGFRPEDNWLQVVLRFADMTAYNELLCGIAARYLGTSPAGMLHVLRADTEKNIGLQAAWYASHGPSLPGESAAGYQAEAGAFRSLAEAWLAAAAQVPALSGPAVASPRPRT
jgi:hypothetical protein